MDERPFGIEFVCTGNVGRSPMAHVLAEYELKSRDLSDRVLVYSSGTDVAGMKEDLIGQFPGKWYDNINKAYMNGVFSPKGMKKAKAIRALGKEEMLATWQNPVLKADLEYLANELKSMDEQFRDAVLSEIGLTPSADFYQPTIVRPEVNLILPLRESNAGKVRELYDGSGHTPLIVTLFDYAGMQGESPTPFGGTVKLYRETRQVLKMAVTKSLDRVQKEYL